MTGYKTIVNARADLAFPTIAEADQALCYLARSSSPAAGAATDSSDSLEAAAAKYVKEFLLKMTSLELGKHLPVFVKTYHWLHAKMAYRFSVVESLETSAWDALEHLDSPVDIDEGRQLLRDFEVAWNDMQTEFETYMDCATAQQLGESDIPRIDVKVLNLSDANAIKYDIIECIAVTLTFNVSVP